MDQRYFFNPHVCYWFFYSENLFSHKLCVVYGVQPQTLQKPVYPILHVYNQAMGPLCIIVVNTESCGNDNFKTQPLHQPFWALSAQYLW